jgi:hypothetical protein
MTSLGCDAFPPCSCRPVCARTDQADYSDIHLDVRTRPKRSSLRMQMVDEYVHGRAWFAITAMLLTLGARRRWDSRATPSMSLGYLAYPVSIPSTRLATVCSPSIATLSTPFDCSRTHARSDWVSSVDSMGYAPLDQAPKHHRTSVAARLNVDACSARFGVAYFSRIGVDVALSKGCRAHAEGMAPALGEQQRVQSRGRQPLFPAPSPYRLGQQRLHPRGDRVPRRPPPGRGLRSPARRHLIHILADRGPSQPQLPGD